MTLTEVKFNNLRSELTLALSQQELNTKRIMWLKVEIAKLKVELKNERNT